MKDNLELAFSDIWMEHKSGLPRLLSVLLHISLVTIAIIPRSTPPPPLPKGIIQVALYLPNRLTQLPSEADSKGGGGGGKRNPLPASLGKLPKLSDRQIVPPDPEPLKNVDPTLVVEPSIVAPQLAFIPQMTLFSIGDPNGVFGPDSAGPGSNNGIGDGDRGGVGDGIGPSFGNDNGIGGERPIRITGGVTEPVLVSQVIPEYSEEARKARFEGTVILLTIVRADGSVQIDRVARGAGFGLDQKAIEAVLKWKFKPARRNGSPVAVVLNVEVNFNLR